MRSLTGYPVIIQVVSIQTTKQTQLSWSAGTWKVFSLSKCVGFPLPFIIFCTYSFYRSIKPYLPHHLQQRMFRRRTTMKTCLQPNYRRLCLATSLCAAMWHQNFIWTTKLLPDLSHMLRSRYAYFNIIWHSLLICDCQLHFNLQTAGSWTSIYGGFDYQGLYNYVVDVFEDNPGPAAKKRAQNLLNWWSM
jgi:hypothetical protein